MGCAVMNTAVPGTRTGFAADTMARNSSSGIARAVRRSATSRRPVFHVVMSVNSSAATASVTQPPCITFNAFAPKNARSISRNTDTTPSAERLRPVPDLGHHHIQQQHGDDHRQRDGNAVCGSKGRGRLEPDHDDDRRAHQRPVHLRQIDLAHLVRRGVLHLEPRREPELNRLTCD